MNQSEALARAQQIIDYPFKDLSVLVKTLTHASVADSRLRSNERLEFLGDSILGMVVCEELYHRFPKYLEGELTKLKSVVVSRKTCALIADKIGLTQLLFLGKGMSGREAMPTSLRAAVFEAMIAGIFLDGGFERARAFIIEHTSYFIDQAAKSEHQDNHKSLLQQYAQKNLSATPQYEQLDEQGPDHSKCFEVCVTVNGHRFASAWGPSKKEAEQQAAMNAMAELVVTGWTPDRHDDDANPPDDPLPPEPAQETSQNRCPE